MNMTRKGRAHLITGGLLVGLILVIALLWANPMVLVWVLLGLMAVMAYGVLYLLVQARMPKADDDGAAEEEESGDDDSVASTRRETNEVETHERPPPRQRIRRTEAQPRGGLEPSREVARELPNGANSVQTSDDGPPEESRPKPRAPRRTKRPASE